MLRHTAFFMLKEGNGPEEMRWMQKGSAYMRFTAAGPVAIDFGTDLFGGSMHLSRDEAVGPDAAVAGGRRGAAVRLRRRAAPRLRGRSRARGLQQGRRPPRDRRVQRLGLPGRADRAGRLVVRGRAADDAGPRPALRDVHLEGRRRTRPRKERGASPRSSGSGTTAGVERLTLATERRDAEDRLRLDPRRPRRRRRRGQGAASRATRTGTRCGRSPRSTKYEWTARMTHVMHGHE